jgi:hypothetical protein
MPFIDFMKFQCSVYFRRWRWLLPVGMGVLLGYWAIQVVRVLNPQQEAISPVANGVTGNALEAFLWAFGKPEIVYFVVTTVFIYLVSDYLPATTYEQWLISRLGSRRDWWFAKVLLVMLSTFLYAVLVFGSFFLVVLPQFPFSSNWSPAALNDFGMGLGYALKNGGPVQGALSISGFLLLGWFAIGLFILSLNQIFQKNWAGFLGGALIVILADLGDISGGPIGGQGWISYLLIQNHLEYTPLWAPVRTIPVMSSIIFWLVWIFISGAVGWFYSKQTDILALEQ